MTAGLWPDDFVCIQPDDSICTVFDQAAGPTSGSHTGSRPGARRQAGGIPNLRIAIADSGSTATDGDPRRPGFSAAPLGGVYVIQFCGDLDAAPDRPGDRAAGGVKRMRTLGGFPLVVRTSGQEVPDADPLDDQDPVFDDDVAFRF